MNGRNNKNSRRNMLFINPLLDYIKNDKLFLKSTKTQRFYIFQQFYQFIIMMSILSLSIDLLHAIFSDSTFS